MSTPAALERDLLRLELIAEARGNGATWAQVGATLGGMSGREAKRRAHHLAKHTGRAWRLEHNQKD